MVPSGSPYWCHFCGIDRRFNPLLSFSVVPLRGGLSAWFCGVRLCGRGFSQRTIPAYCVGERALFETHER